MRKQTKSVSEKLDSLRESSQDEGQYTLRYFDDLEIRKRAKKKLRQ